MVKSIEFFSKEMIKPSNPTPRHLRNYKLSFLDQIAPSAYVRVILFYEHTINTPLETSLLLKKSLAKTLTRFYPLAGRVVDDFVIECNDEGAEYSEVRVPFKLSEAIESKDAKEIKTLFLYDMHFDIKNEAMLAVQFNVFDCGGIAIGLSFSHKIVDGTSVTAFLLAWSAFTRGASSVINGLDLDSALHFPPTNVSGYNRPTKGDINRDKIATKRFKFSKSSIAALREAAAKPETTRYEAVTAFLWRRLMAIFESKQEPKNKLEYAAVHAVNLRARMVPPLTSKSFGNIWQYAVASSPTSANLEIQNQNNNQESYHSTLVSQTSRTIREINGDYVKKLQNGEWYMNWMKQKIKNVELIAFTSWCSFPMYEIDFGWGNPIFATSLGRPYKNVTVLTSDRNGDGIEIWINLLEVDMVVFENDSEVLSFVS